MIPVLSAEQIRSADAFTIKNEPVSSINLMERAARACFDVILDNYDTQTHFLVVCGQGNNGGDGLVIARLLHNAGYKADVIILKLKEKGSNDFEHNLERLKKETSVVIRETDGNENASIFNNYHIIIEALFGTGLQRPVEGDAAKLIHLINTSEKTVISVDIPGGLFSEGKNTHISFQNTVMADITVTFQAPKLSFLLPDTGMYVGDFVVLDIGLDNNYIRSLDTSYCYTEQGDARIEQLSRQKFSHKGTFGHSLIIAGSRGKTGAAVLASHACLRAGSGMVTVHAPLCSLDVLQAAIPEVMVSVDNSEDYVSQLPDISPFRAICAGPGLGTDIKTSQLIKNLIQNSGNPLILDADALNILSQNKTWLSFLPPSSILTPHPGEFDRLFGKTDNHYDRLKLQQAMSVKYSVIIILKGAHTSISTPSGKVYFNSTGNPGMATAGSGDVLSGIITALYAQHPVPLFAAITGVYLHGLAGDYAASENGHLSMIAGDIILNLSDAIESCMK